MTLQQWLDNSWIREAERSRQETRSLLGIAEREIADASLEGISGDGRFNHAYNAVRTLCQVALLACGFSVPKGGRQHERVIESLKFTLGQEWSEEADYFDLCRRMRHKSSYEGTGIAQSKDADDLLAAARKLYQAIEVWLATKHPDLV